MLGTPGYMSPEQARGEVETLGTATDIYALGAMLYEVLCGQPPYVGTLFDVLDQRRRHPVVPSPLAVKQEVPRPLAAICQKAMALQPEDRYPSAAELAREIDHYLADEPVAAYTEPWRMRAGRWARRHRTLVTTGIAVLVVAVVLCTVGLVLLEGARQQEAAAKQEALAARDRVRQTVEDMSSQEMLRLLEQQPHLTPEQRHFLERMVSYYRELVQESTAVLRPEQRQRQALAFTRMGEMLGHLVLQRYVDLAWAR